MKDGGGTFRARFGVERDGQTLLAEGSWSEGLARSRTAIPNSPWPMLKRLGWFDDLTAAEKASIEPRISAPNIDRATWSTDLSGGIIRVAMEHGCSPYRQRQGARRRLEPAGPGAGAPRADLHRRGPT